MFDYIGRYCASHGFVATEKANHRACPFCTCRNCRLQVEIGCGSCLSRKLIADMTAVMKSRRSSHRQVRMTGMEMTSTPLAVLKECSLMARLRKDNWR